MTIHKGDNVRHEGTGRMGTVIATGEGTEKEPPFLEIQWIGRREMSEVNTKRLAWVLVMFFGLALGVALVSMIPVVAVPLPGFWLLTADSGQVYQGQATIRASGVSIESDGAYYLLPWKQVWGLTRPEPQTGWKAPVLGEPSG